MQIKKRIDNTVTALSKEWLQPKRHALRRRALSVVIVIATAITGVVVPVAPAQASATYHTWATSVNVRNNPNDPTGCSWTPSTTSCPVVVDQVNPWDSLTVNCQRLGQVIGGNPYWLWVVTPRRKSGWMTSYYIDYPDNRLPDVPDCVF